MLNFPLAPPAASNFAGEHDTLFYAITGLSLLFFVATFFFVIYFALKYRIGTSADRSSPMYENMRMEILWIIIPTILGLFIFAWGAKLFVDMRTPPANAKELYVIGKQWMWHIQHPNGVRENNTLHVPIDTDIKLTMISQDVIHAFYIPAFRQQYMVVPGRYTQMWFRPTKTGRYHLFCNMYCGTQHSEMGGTVVVMTKTEYAEWLAANGTAKRNLTPVQAGEKIFNKIGCANCHGEKDLVPRGPTLNGLFGATRETNDGRRFLADETYIRESILRPAEKITKGYAETMQPYEGQLSEEEVASLLAYIKAGLPGSGQYEKTPSDEDATPTRRGNDPAVGALAAQKEDEK
jgi:cytochrome c oxidase subunit II